MPAVVVVPSHCPWETVPLVPGALINSKHTLPQPLQPIKHRHATNPTLVRATCSHSPTMLKPLVLLVVVLLLCCRWHCCASLLCRCGCLLLRRTVSASGTCWTPAGTTCRSCRTQQEPSLWTVRQPLH